MGRTNKPGASGTKNNKVISGRAGKKSAHMGGKAPRAGYGGKAPRKGLPTGAAQEPKVRKPHRFRPGTVALREIRAMQKSTDLLLRRNPFIRLVRARAQEFDSEVRFQAGALALLQIALENELTGNYSAAHAATLHGKRITLCARDLRVARYITATAPGKPITEGISSGGLFAAPPSRAKAKKSHKKKKAKATDDAMEGVEQQQQEDDAAAENDEGEGEDDDNNNEPNTEEAAINPLVQVAQEMTVRDEDAPAAPAPGTPKERRVPSTPPKEKKKGKAGSKKDDAPAFTNEDMSAFAPA
jgi:histone H3